MKKQIAFLLLATTLVLASLPGCGSKVNEEPVESSEAGKSPESDTITINACLSTGMTGAVNNFAIEKGLYKELGIEFNAIEWTSNSEVLALFSRGEIDFADGDPSSYIPGIANGVPAKLVGNMWRYSGCYWLVGNKDIKSIEDLKGKAVGSAFTAGGMKLSVLKMLEANGISEEEVELIPNGVYQGAYATLITGETDATIIHNPYAALAVSEGVGNILGKAWDYIPDYYTGTLLASDKIIQERPEDLQRLITAYYQVHEEVKNEYFDEFIKWAAIKMNVDESVMREAVESELEVWVDYPVIPEDRLNTTIDILHSYGWLDENINSDGTYDNTFAIKAAEELGLKDPFEK